MCLTFAPEGDIIFFILDIKLLCLQLWREMLFPSSEDLQDLHKKSPECSQALCSEDNAHRELFPNRNRDSVVNWECNFE